MTGAGGGRTGGQINFDGTDVAGDTERVEEGGSHYDLAGPGWVHAVFAADGKVRTEWGSGGGGLHHRPPDVGEGALFGGGDFDADGAQLAETGVQVVFGAGGGLHPAGHAVDRPGRADDDAGASGFEGAHDAGHFFLIDGADFLGVRHIPVIVHAVAGGGHRRFKPEHVILHAIEKPGRLLSAPAELAHVHFQFWQAGAQICF